MTNPVWTTPAGLIGIFPAQIFLNFQLVATPVLPAVSLTYNLISGSLPDGVVIDENGLIAGTPALVTEDTLYNFVVRVIDNFNNIKDRTFSITVSGVAPPEFITPTGNILTTFDSLWIELPIQYTNPCNCENIRVRVLQGNLPPGLEINSAGLIRGYPEPPTNIINLPEITTLGFNTTGITNIIRCTSTSGFSVGRPVVFTGSVIGGIVLGQTYYIREVLTAQTFTISTTEGGEIVNLSTDSGDMIVTLPPQTVGQPTIRSFSFTLGLDSNFGSDIESYNITVINQNTPVNQGGPGNVKRSPTIYNTRPPTYNIESDPSIFSYYVLPPKDSVQVEGETYSPSQAAYIGQFYSDDLFQFKILGHDFDGDKLIYVYDNDSLNILGLTGDPVTGWITGTPVIPTGITELTFTVAVGKLNGTEISTEFQSPIFTFNFRLTDDIDGNILWLTDSNLGTISNGTISTLKVEALSDVSLQYRLGEFSDPLPPNLILLNNGEISGYLAYQPTDRFLPPGSSTKFNFTIEAYSPEYTTIIKSSRTFTLTVVQEYEQPTDNLYIKCTPGIDDRILINSLLSNDEIIPEEMLYRSEDENFGKAKNVIYAHAYGIYSSNFPEYVAAVTKNHYWRYITLGSIETAVAKNSDGEIIYEVVYSKVIDNLINPKGQSVSQEIFWPQPINLNLGPWYTSSTDIYTSYEIIIDTTLDSQLQQNLLTQDFIPIIINQGTATFYTSLSPGYGQALYPNSLPNMRNRVSEVLGQEFNSNLLPLWMTSQQKDGSTLGFTQAWVIAYTKPGFSETIKENIQTKWVDILGNPLKLNLINFKIDRFTVDKSLTYNYDKGVSPPAWTGLPSATPVPNPKDSKDFYVLFPRKTILPDKTQY